MQEIRIYSRSKTYDKIFGGPKLGQNKPKSGLKLGFLPFLQVWFIGFVEIAYNDSLKQCLTSGGGNTFEKNLGAQIGAQIGSEIRFFTVFSSLVH